MGKFADPDYKHNEPETITKRREEFIAFQKECYQVELKVLALFALALDVPPYKQSKSNFVSYLQIIFLNTILPRKTFSGLQSTRLLQLTSHSWKQIWEQGHTVISEPLLSCTSPARTLNNNRFQDDVGGLQVLSNGEWVDATPIPDTILFLPLTIKLISSVNVADAMQFWSSETLKSTKHRVLVPKKTRFSLVYFVVADPETVRLLYFLLMYSR